MTRADLSMNGVSGGDLWKWLLGAMLSLSILLASFGLTQLAQANLQRIERLEALTDSLRVGRETNASDIRVLQTRFDTILQRLDALDRKMDQVLEDAP